MSNAKSRTAHAVFLESHAANMYGDRVRGTPYRRSAARLGDDYDYQYHLTPNKLAEEIRRNWLDAVRRCLDQYLSPEEAALLLRVFPAGELSLRELSRQTGLQPSTWSRRLKQLLRRLERDPGLRALAGLGDETCDWIVTA